VLDYILRARAAINKPPSRGRNAAVIRLCEHALALDPGSAEAKSVLAGNLASGVMDNMTDTAAADIKRAEYLAWQALDAAPRSPTAHWAKGQVLRAQRRYAEAIPEYEAVLAHDPNSVRALFNLGACKIYTGSIEETIPLIERAMRLSPHEPRGGSWYHNIGLVHLLQSRTEQAVTWLERARNALPVRSSIRASLAAAYALSSETERAAAELALP
jgi:adenylate cyclase